MYAFMTNERLYREDGVILVCSDEAEALWYGAGRGLHVYKLIKYDDAWSAAELVQHGLVKEGVGVPRTVILCGDDVLNLENGTTLDLTEA